MQSTRIALVSSTAVLALVLTACGSDDDKDGAQAAASATTAFPPTATPGDVPSPTTTDRGATGEAATNTPVDAGQFPTTAPGTELKVGESAVIPFEQSSKQGVLQVTITAIEKGTIGDLTAANIRVNDDQKSSTPYYVRATIKNVSDADLSDASLLVPLAALDEAGRDLAFTTVLGSFKKCPLPRAENFTNGAEVSGCKMVMAPAGATVAAAGFDLPRKSSGEPVIWKP
ncbi:hypothetical protein LO772_33520 [Yinghuangia sp. ASG 101]|uniref:hypothetical protein n=1 Tax=Yinghuangia sp. ASG 101 TaxID=2896848 RepID=UPI001E55D4D6|nr:hypothetical protein [Yinghuangia sp. ASG 101]UGQ11639.1 hypothetical protein LO772_33520 [Yinghuangia sp. ASG 101]